jgi:hypothetical protein
MATDRPDPADFLEMAQRMMRQFFDPPRSDDPRDDDDNLWASATRRGRESRERAGHREPSPEKQRENLTFALATRAVEALEDLALNVAAIRQRLERSAPTAAAQSPDAPPPSAERPDAGTERPDTSEE